jgi:hypothetical protein
VSLLVKGLSGSFSKQHHYPMGSEICVSRFWISIALSSTIKVAANQSSKYDEPNFAGRRVLMVSEPISNKSSRRFGWLLLLLIVFAALAVVILPVWLIQPFRPQTQRGLEISFALRRWSPLITVIALTLSLLFVGALIRGARWWSKGLLVLALLPLLVATWFARQNHFEWMFNPLANSAYAKASEANFVADNDMVLAVERNGEAAAYPIRLMAYHHLVQDVVGGTPLVATY